MASLIDKLQKDKRDSLEYMKSSLTADKQVTTLLAPYLLNRIFKIDA